MILLSFSSSIKYILSLMLATLGLLPMENIVEEEKNKEIFPTEINNLPADNTLFANDSLTLSLQTSIHPDTTCFRVIHFNNCETDNLLNNEVIIVEQEDFDYVLFYKAN